VSVVSSSIVIAATPEDVWAVVMDPHRLREWVTIHRELRSCSAGPPQKGATMEQILHVRGADLRVRWLLTECAEPVYAHWEGTGPARSTAHIEYQLTAMDAGTRFDYRNDFHPPLGALGALASRTFMGHVPQREADRSLTALRGLIEPAPR
jgi:uncharacterized protein YndB with AHSA1/START domain